ncbi:MAG: hypothetical protein JXJ04_03055 [Spirochaetales bacterium]|nr:hypothetical protein [Spirochaetales bacterium]
MVDMEALRYVQKINGTTLTIAELAKFNGKECEIIIFPVEKEKPGSNLPLPKHKLGIKSTLERTEIYENER